MPGRKARGFKDAKTEDELLVEILGGGERVQRYKAIHAPLLLSIYRTGDNFRLDDAVLREARFFSYDFAFLGTPPNLFKGLCYQCAIWGLGLFGYLKNALKARYRYPQTKKINCLLSNTLLYNKRYVSTREAIEKKYNCRSIYALCDGCQLFPVREVFSASMARDHGNSRPVMLLSASAIGGKLKKAMKDWYIYLNDLRHNNEKMDEEKVDRLLSRLETEYTKREKIIEKKIKRAGISVFVTINQYNLRDILVIEACRNLNIRTVQQMHYMEQFTNDNFTEEYPMLSTTYVQEYSLWSEEERRFHQTFIRYKDAFNGDSKLTFRVCGNIELTRDTALDAIKRYPAQRRLTFMTAPLASSDLDTAEQIAAVKAWRWDIYKALRELGIKQKVIIRIRYKPFEEMEFRAEEVPVLKEWGFEISESLPTDLLEDMCCSLAVMSATSSVMATAKLLGRIVYRIEDPSVTYVHVDPAIHDVKIADVANIRLPEDLIPQVAPPEAFFTAEKLLEPKG